MNNACPISFSQINERVARVNGALTAISMMVFLLTPFKVMVLVLGADLLIRGFLKAEYSFYSLLSRKLLAAFKVPPKMTNAGPKLFAARGGVCFLFSDCAVVFYRCDGTQPGGCRYADLFCAA